MEPTYFGIRRESAFDAGAAPTAFLPLTSLVAQETATPRVVTPYGTSLGEPRGFAFGGTVQADVEAQPDSVGHLLTAVFGPPQTIPFQGAFRHTWEFRGDRPTYAVEGVADTTPLRATGAMAGALGLRMSAGQRLLANVSFVTRRVVAQASLTATTFQAEEASLWHRTTVTVSGVAETAASVIDLSFTAPVRILAGWGSTGRAAQLRTANVLTAQFGAILEGVSSAWLGYFQQEREVSIAVTMAGGTVGTTSYSLAVNYPRARVALLSTPVAVRNLIRMNVQAVPFGAPGAARGVSVVGVNNTAGY